MDSFVSDGYDPPYNSNAYISPYEDTFAHYAHASDPQMPLSPRSSSAIASASREVLMRLGNVAHISLNAQYIQAKSDLQSHRCVVSFSSTYMRIYLTDFHLGILLHGSKP